MKYLEAEVSWRLRHGVRRKLYSLYFITVHLSNVDLLHYHESTGFLTRLFSVVGDDELVDLFENWLKELR